MSWRDRIYCTDARHMQEVPDESVSLVVTSPPYNVNKQYGDYVDAQEWQDYMLLLEKVWCECYRVLRPGGRIAINVANTGRQPYIPLHAFIIEQMRFKFLMRGEILWNKAASAGVSTAWGSFARASNPTLRDVHEYILVFSKGAYKLETGPSGITNQDFVNWTRSVWEMPTESAKRIGHPAPFPVELPRRLILLYSGIGDVILDPFVGSGTTCVAAKMTGRHYVGYDIDPDYCARATARLEATPGGD